MKAVWKGQLIAESAQTEIVEGNHYFPAGSLSNEYFIKSTATTHCSWKGDASYYSIVVDGQTNRDAAWYYPAPKTAAKEIAGMVAFWRGVSIEE